MVRDRIVWLIPMLLMCVGSGCSTLQQPRFNDPDQSALAGERPREKTLVERFRNGLKSQPNPNRARALYAAAENQFKEATRLTGEARSERFAEAAKQYGAAARAWPATALAEDSLMMAAEASFFADRYPKASSGYEEVIKNYPNTRHLDRIDQRRFQIAQYWLAHSGQNGGKWYDVNVTDDEHPTNDTFGHAVRLLDRIRFDNPNGKLADDATMSAAVANFRRGRYSEADILFADIRENFPRSEHQFRAHLLGLKCKQNLYRGSDYDGSVLRDAEEIIHQMVRLFPQEAAQHRAELTAELKDIRLKQAERDFVMAQFFDERKEYGAARIYYDMVRREYSDTNLALDSESRLAQIDGQPEVPKSSFQWLVDAIPEEPPAKPLITRETVTPTKR
jgi:outer membrane protein assembly factor BamD (BamD/ComL family)